MSKPKSNISKNEKDNIITITHKGEKYTEEDLDVIYEIVAEKYIPTNKYIDDIDYEPKENLSDKDLKDLNEWKVKIRASSWKSRQRSLRKKRKLDQVKIDTLNKLGMVWNPKEDEWEKQYLIYRKTGLCDEIEEWVMQQRELLKSNEISNENLYRLNAVNFPFDATKGEHFAFTYNSINLLQEKMRKKIRRIELKLINKPPKKLTQKQKNIINREKQDKQRREAQKPTNSFYTKFYMISGRVERDLLKLNFLEIKNIIKQIESGKSVYYESKKEYLDNAIKNRVLGHFTKSFVTSNFYDDINIDMTTNQKFNQISIFNSTKLDIEIRKYTCKILLKYFELIADKKVKKFKPLDFLISCSKKEKNIDELLSLEKFINNYPLLFQLYNDKMKEILKKLK